jgi:hypothetical protein
MPEGKKLDPHPLVTRLGRGPAQKENLTPIVGWPGDAEEAARLRIYLDLGFTSYYEVARDAVVDVVPTDPANENAPFIVWVLSVAQAQLTITQSVTGEVAALAGGISGRNLAGSARMSRAVSAERMVKADSGTWSCPIRTLDPPCTVSDLFCPTNQCGPTSESWCTIGSWC